MNLAIKYLCVLIILVAGAAAAEPVRHADPSGQPNAVAQISQRLLSDLFVMPVEKTVSITDNVLGTAVRGSVRTQGRVVPLLIPDTNRGVLHLRFSGTSSSPRMVGRNGPATIFSSARTDAELWKTVIFEEQGIRNLPTEGNVSTRLSINGVAAKRRLVERIARKRASRSHADAQAITSNHTKVRLGQEIDHEAAKPLAKAQDNYINKVRNPLAARGALPKLMRFSTTSEHLRLVLQQCSRSQVPPPTSVPEIELQHDIGVALHQSSVSSLCEVFYASRTLEDREILQIVHTVTGEDPRPLRIHSRTPRWSVTMADRQPLNVAFADGHASIGLHLKLLKHGERRYDGAFHVSVRYHLEKTPGGPRLTRQGDVQIDGQTESGSPGELGEAILVLRSKFSAVFAPTLTFDGLAPPTGGGGIWDKIGQLKLAQLDAKDGWLIVGYQLPRRDVLVASRGLKR